MEPISESLIAPCGMNCGVCKWHLREKDSCGGCHIANAKRYKSIARCKIRTCTERKGKFCYDCEEFPCDKLEHLDRRYRAKYNMSEIANLECIRDCGMEKFLESERKKYQSDKGILCVHDKKHYLPNQAKT